MAHIPTIPEHRDLLSHSIEAVGASPRIKHVVHFDYADCTRSFDGEKWAVAPKPTTNLYDARTGAPIYR